MHRLVTLAAGLAIAALMALSPARAYTPENGAWWNPNEPGYGLLIETQDNFMAVFVYVYDSAGNPIWYTATDFLTGSALFEAELDRFRDGPCIGCSFTQNTAFPGAGGPIRIAFDPDDQTRATLTWGGRSVPIERFHFYLKRPEDEQQLPGVRTELTKMLGEWQMVLDFTDNPNASSQYFGDIVILDNLDFDDAGDFVDGCRAADSEIGFCRQVDVDENYAAVEYVASTDEHVLVVENTSTTYAAYFIRVGTNEFEGDVSVYPIGTNPDVFYPVHGFRTASRSFVQEGVGPSKAEADSTTPPAAQVLPAGAAGTGSAKQLDDDRRATIRRLEQRIQQAKATR